MNAIILSIGDELVLGQTVDTNSAWLSAQLAACGFAVIAHATVGDDQAQIESALLHSLSRCDLVIVSGGLGPTDDDLTRQALAAAMGVPLELNQQWLTQIEQFFRDRGRPMPVTNRIQAMIPRGATMIPNSCGTAAGIFFPVPAGGKNVFVVPGVPKEMKAMFDRDILPFVRQQSGGAVILSRTLHTFGKGESTVAEQLGELMKRDRNPSVGTTVANNYVSLRVNARFDSLAEAEKQLDATELACREKLGDLIIGADSDTLPEVIAKFLIDQKKSVATAESCTGGWLAKYLTDVSGSSAYFTNGWVTYSNLAKYERLGVNRNVIDLYGAVSEPVVKEMSQNARRLAKADFGLAISGVAGPTGGTPAKPVGMVCFALAHAEGTLLRTYNFPGDREMIRDRAAKMALSMLRCRLLGKDQPF